MSDTYADLVAAVAEFRAALPGWWFSVGECSVSRDASCGPDNAYCSKALLVAFDSGFHADLTDVGSTMADALRQVTRDAVMALTSAKPEPAPPASPRNSQ